MSINKRLMGRPMGEDLADRAVMKPKKDAPTKPEAKSTKQQLPEDNPVWPGGVDRFHEHA